MLPVTNTRNFLTSLIATGYLWSENIEKKVGFSLDIYPVPLKIADTHRENVCVPNTSLPLTLQLSSDAEYKTVYHSDETLGKYCVIPCFINQEFVGVEEICLCVAQYLANNGLDKWNSLRFLQQ